MLKLKTAGYITHPAYTKINKKHQHCEVIGALLFITTYI